MRLHRIVLAVMVLLLASLACNIMSGNRQNNGVATEPSANSSPTASGQNTSTVKTDFPLTADAYNITDVGDGSIVFYTKMSRDDVLKFYRDTYAAKGYKERQILTVISDNTFNIVFDGDPSGKSVVIQSVDLGDGSRTISIRLELITQ